jgi:hypothetical protein
MQLEAIAVLPLPRAAFEAACPPVDGGFSAADGSVVQARFLEDGTCLRLGLSVVDTELEHLVRRLVAVLGPAAATVVGRFPIYPASHELAATDVAAAGEELGDGADWVTLVPATPAALDVEALASMPMPDLANLDPANLEAMTQMLQGPGGEELMKAAAQMAQQMVASGALPPGLAEGAAPDLGNLDMGALAAQAEAFAAANPDLVEQLGAQLGAAPPEEDD